MSSVSRLSTWLAVGALVAIGTVAAIDAVRSGEGPSRVAPKPAEAASLEQAMPRIAGRAALAAELRQAGVTGALAFTDRNCRPGALYFPGLEEKLGPPVPRCGLGPSTRRIPSPDGRLAARCGGGAVEVLAQSGERLARFDGCAPAWRPDGALTYVRRGSVVVRSPSCLRSRARGCSRVILSRRDLEAALRADSAAVERIAWLSEKRFAAVLGGASSEPVDVVAVFEGRRLVAAPALAAADVLELAVSPHGRYVAARGERGVWLLDRRGQFAANNRYRLSLLPARVIAWSPDDGWLAIAARSSTYLVRAGERDGEVLRLPLAASALSWVSG